MLENQSGCETQRLILFSFQYTFIAADALLFEQKYSIYKLGLLSEMLEKRP